MSGPLVLFLSAAAGTGAPVPDPAFRDGTESAARWEFPKGGVESGESTKQAAAREFQEETSLSDWSFREGFERTLSYTYIRRGRKVIKTVTYFLVEVRDPDKLACSAEHVEDPNGQWYRWGTFDEISELLYHTKIRQVFAEADTWLKG